jgi:hypothetical protein
MAYKLPTTSDADEWRHMYEERVGIHLDSGLPVAEAEALAREQTTELYRRAKRKEDTNAR